MPAFPHRVFAAECPCADPHRINDLSARRLAMAMEETTMASTKDISGWHAHVYYTRETRPRAEALRTKIEELFLGGAHPVRMGRWRETPVGPHPLPMYQVAFDNELFGEFVPWLAMNRQGLDILVHASTTNSDLWDHTEGAGWLGKSLELNTGFFADMEGKSA